MRVCVSSHPCHSLVYNFKWLKWQTLTPCDTCLLLLNRSLLKKFQAKCWSFEYLDCGDGDFVGSDCLTSMDPAHILGADPECKQAFTATLGSVLHAPCSCKGMQGKEQQTCHRIHDVFHNRSLFRELVWIYFFFFLNNGQMLICISLLIPHRSSISEKPERFVWVSRKRRRWTKSNVVTG